MASRVMRYIFLGDSSAVVPHIVLLDAGLASSFNRAINHNVRKFFEAIVANDGISYGEAILGLADRQPYVKSPSAFIAEVDRKCREQREVFDNGGGDRAGENIKDYIDSVRAHRVVLDPTVMIALMSMLVLEGWQVRLDPGVSIMDGIKQAVPGGIFGYASQFTATMQKAMDLFKAKTD